MQITKITRRPALIRITVKHIYWLHEQKQQFPASSASQYKAKQETCTLGR